MRKLIMKMSLSVDGFVGDVNGKNDWIFKSSDPESQAWAAGPIKECGLILMGSTSFETMASFWPTASGPFAEPMNKLPKAVFTQKGFRVPAGLTDSWAEARVFDGDLAEEIKQLKQEPGKHLYALGGAGLMRSLISMGLIDEYHLAIHPVALGAGVTIFGSLTKQLDLKLVATRSFTGGIIGNTYLPG